MARKARKRLVRTVKPAQAVAAALTGVVAGRPRTSDEPQVVVGASLLRGPRALLDAATREPVAPGRAARRRCATTSARA